MCVWMWGRRCRAATVRVKSCALCCLSNPGAWDVVDLDLQAWPGQTVCLRPVRSRIGQQIDRPTNQPTTPTTISRKCDTTRSAACVIRKQSPLPPDAGNANPRDYLFGSEDRVLGAIPKSNHKPESGIVEQGDNVRVPCSVCICRIPPLRRAHRPGIPSLAPSMCHDTRKLVTGIFRTPRMFDRMKPIVGDWMWREAGESKPCSWESWDPVAFLCLRGKG